MHYVCFPSCSFHNVFYRLTQRFRSAQYNSAMMACVVAGTAVPTTAPISPSAISVSVACGEALIRLSAILGRLETCTSTSYPCSQAVCVSACENGSLASIWYTPDGANGPSYVGLSNINRLVTQYTGNITTATVSSCPGFASCTALCSAATITALGSGVCGTCVFQYFYSCIILKKITPSYFMLEWESRSRTPALSVWCLCASVWLFVCVGVVRAPPLL